ncbi:hypothetical protein PI87_27855 [Ralstonia sp. A12]|uniref:nucleotidyl transferase AbiEii/AbiGii toxin family protein n=1 Tax=Ralstonia sp. A12 TaxID=1217052 RepID=UPI000573A207|nr:nucleotidyl transferase AbiEii/AbiGii toxin family protein [Ralstonia sp. A12]KHK48538.1 hypothetical protein PI87_27855 [Ralstonia sp. A12]
MTELEAWVHGANDNVQKTFRSVVHIILSAIASHHELRPEMVMKGGILAAILYHTGRFTRDIDFSSQKHYKEFMAGQDTFLSNLAQAINLAAEELPYGIACRIQGHELRPGIEGNYQTLHLRVAYALKSNRNMMTRLAAGQAANVVQIDYSFNELVGDISTIEAGGDEPLAAYGQLTFMAEKLRAILQQANVEGGRVRGSPRGQDIFDLHALLRSHPLSFEQQEHLLQLLIDKAKSRGLDIDRSSMSHQDIYNKCKVRYQALKDEIDGDLPDFDEAFGVVKVFYEALPWLNK